MGIEYDWLSLIRQVTGPAKELRGWALPEHRNVGELGGGVPSWAGMAAARELRCSDAYIYLRFKTEGLTLGNVLDAPKKKAPRTGLPQNPPIQLQMPTPQPPPTPSS